MLAIGVLGFPFLAMNAWGLYIVTAFGILATSTLPDIDQKTALFKHRGWTHTIWFAIIVGVLYFIFILVVGLFFPGLPLLALVGLAVVGGFAAGLGVCVHIVGDIMTVQGIWFW